MIICIDFDGTLCDHQFPEIGEEAPHAFFFLKKFQEAGAKLILWTMRSDLRSDGISTEGHKANQNYLTDAVEWCRKRGVEFWGHNENLEQKSWTTSRKCYANLYIDDAAHGCPLMDNPKVGGRKMVDWSVVGPQVLVWIGENQ